MPPPAFKEDLKIFFSPGTPGYAKAVYTPSGGGADAPVNGNFGDEYQALDFGGASMESGKPIFTCASADVPDIGHDARLVINGNTYRVAEVKPDGAGIVSVRLEKS